MAVPLRRVRAEQDHRLVDLALAVDDLTPASAGQALLDDDEARELVAAELWDGSPRDTRPLGEIFEGLEHLPPPAPLQRRISVRASNLLRNDRLGTWHELAEASPAHLTTLPGLGKRTFLEIIDMILVAWTAGVPPSPGHFGTAPESVTDSHGPHTLDRQGRGIADPVVDGLAEGLRWLWIHRGSQTLAQALDDFTAFAADEIPRDLAESTAHLAATRLDEAMPLPVFGAEDWRWLLDFDDRTLQILEQRVYAEKGTKATLEQLAETGGVSRERIRQIERDAIDALDVRQAQDRAQGLHHLAARLRRSARHLIPPAEFATIVSTLLDESGAPEIHRRLCSAVLCRTAGEWVSWGAHLATTDLDHAIAATTDRWRAAGSAFTIPPEELDRLLSELGVVTPSPELFRELGVNIIEGVAVWWGRTQGDRAVAVLAATGRVMRFSEIYSAVGGSRSPRSMQNALLVEARMMRRGKETWGLRSWGGEEYTGLFDELEQAIERAGGSVSLSDVVDRFVAEFGVKAGSVLSYAADRRFIKHADGTLSMRTAADPEVQFAEIPIEQTAGAYRLNGVWHVCLEIDDDAIRGSGRQLRRGIGQAAGLEPDLTFAVIYDAGTVVFTWPGSQPHIGSVRELVSHHGCGPGDLLLLPLAGPEPRPSRVVRHSEKSRWGGVARVAAEMGLDPVEIDEDEQPLEVADAVGLPPGADWHDIADRIRDRRDQRVAALLPEHLR